MIDFYKRLGFDNYNKSEDEINSKLNSLPADIKEAIIYILLHDRRKQVYDKINRTLRQIGILRNLFGYAIDDEFWGSEYNDFNIQIREYINTIQKKKKRRWVKVLLSFFPIIIIGIIFLISSVSTERKNTVTPPISPSSVYDSQSQQDIDTGNYQKKSTNEEQKQNEYEKFKEQHPPLLLPDTGIMKKKFQWD